MRPQCIDPIAAENAILASNPEILREELWRILRREPRKYAAVSEVRDGHFAHTSVDNFSASIAVLTYESRMLYIDMLKNDFPIVLWQGKWGKHDRFKSVLNGEWVTAEVRQLLNCYLVYCDCRADSPEVRPYALPKFRYCENVNTKKWLHHVEQKSENNLNETCSSRSNGYIPKAS